MLNLKATIAVLSVAAALAVNGCSQLPADQESATNVTLDAARSAEAETYAAATWTEAQEAAKRAEAELASQGEKLGFMRSYGKANEMLIEAQGLAEKARAEAIAAKESARLETTAALDAANAELAAARTLLATAPRGKDTRAEFESMQQELVGLQSSLDAAAQLVRSEQFQMARTQIDQVNTQVAAISADLQNAVAKVQAQK